MSTKQRPIFANVERYGKNKEFYICTAMLSRPPVSLPSGSSLTSFGPKRCAFVPTSGPNKGTRCKRDIKMDSSFCSQHKSYTDRREADTDRREELDRREADNDRVEVQGDDVKFSLLQMITLKPRKRNFRFPKEPKMLRQVLLNNTEKSMGSLLQAVLEARMIAMGLRLDVTETR